MANDLDNNQGYNEGDSAIGKARARNKESGVSEPSKKNVGGRPSKESLEQAKQVEAIISPESIGQTLTLLYDIPEIATGWDGWALEPDEQKYLGNAGAIAIKPFIKFDTKWLAVGIFGIALLKVTTTKMLMYREYKKEKAKQEAMLNEAKKEK